MTQPTAQEILTLSNRVRDSYGTNPNTAPYVTAATALAASLNTPPVDPPITLPPNVRLNLKEYASSRPSGFGSLFGRTIPGDIVFPAGNKVTPSETIINLRSWRFVAPSAGLTGAIIVPPGGGAQVTCISRQPGDFRGPSEGGLPYCRINGSNKQFNWTTGSALAACPLIPGQTYYLNAGHFRLTNYVQNGEFVSACGCASPACQGCNVVFQMRGG